MENYKDEGAKNFNPLKMITNPTNFDLLGVEKVDAKWETKNVEVTCIESIDGAALLVALEKWSASSGKSVELITA